MKNGFQFTESDRAKRNRELVKRDNNNVFDFLESEGYIRLKADACTSSKELYEVYKMWCEENSLNAIKARGFSDALIANQRRYNLESTNNIVNSSGRRVRGFVGIEALVQPDLTTNSWRACPPIKENFGVLLRTCVRGRCLFFVRTYTAIVQKRAR